VFFSLGIAELAEVFASGGNWIEKIGLQYHFRSISRGVIDTRDLLFFVSFAVAFLGLTVFKIKTIRK
jgi:ABC-2 type transport system permease protein